MCNFYRVTLGRYLENEKLYCYIEQGIVLEQGVEMIFHFHCSLSLDFFLLIVLAVVNFGF